MRQVLKHCISYDMMNMQVLQYPSQSIILKAKNPSWHIDEVPGVISDAQLGAGAGVKEIGRLQRHVGADPARGDLHGGTLPLRLGTEPVRGAYMQHVQTV